MKKLASSPLPKREMQRIDAQTESLIGKKISKRARIAAVSRIAQSEFETQRPNLRHHFENEVSGGIGTWNTLTAHEYQTVSV